MIFTYFTYLQFTDEWYSQEKNTISLPLSMKLIIFSSGIPLSLVSSLNLSKSLSEISSSVPDNPCTKKTVLSLRTHRNVWIYITRNRMCRSDPHLYDLREPQTVSMFHDTDICHPKNYILSISVSVSRRNPETCKCSMNLGLNPSHQATDLLLYQLPTTCIWHSCLVLDPNY